MSNTFYLDDYGLITSKINEVYFNRTILLYKNGEQIDYSIETNDGIIKLLFDKHIEDKDRFLVKVGNDSYSVVTRFIVHTKKFDELYKPDLTKLGSSLRLNTVKFRVWAPFADKVNVVVNGKTHEMEYEDNGVYIYKSKGFYDKAKYHYEVLRNGKWQSFKDPFSYSCVNGKEESYVIDKRKISFKNVKTDITIDPIIYEVSVRDFSSDENAPFKYKRKFKAFSETNLKIDDKPIGLDYLKHIGVSHIQLLPVQTFDLDKGEYNWGYNPMEFNTFHWDYVDGKDAYSPIYEFRQLVDSLHSNGLKVTLDVVYNHVYSHANFAMHKMLPYYFFRYEPDGSMGNASGCGSELRSEAPFFREYLLEINKRLIEIYDVDGLRFDLMGILDINTMNYLNDELKSIKRDFLMYGEGWHMGDIVPDDEKASLNNAYKMREIFLFNPNYRDALKGGFGNEHIKGYFMGNRGYEEDVKSGLLGSYNWGLNKDQALNYVECHDNATFYDKMKKCGIKEEDTTNMLKSTLAAIVLSRGIPFIHAGLEFKRTKNGIDNSYNLPDSINKLDWNLAINNEATIRHLRKLIELRRNNPVFRANDNGTISYFWETMIFHIGNLDLLINPTDHTCTYYSDFKYKKVLLDDSKYYYDVGTIDVPKYSVIVCEK